MREKILEAVRNRLPHEDLMRSYRERASPAEVLALVAELDQLANRILKAGEKSRRSPQLYELSSMTDESYAALVDTLTTSTLSFEQRLRAASMLSRTTLDAKTLSLLVARILQNPHASDAGLYALALTRRFDSAVEEAMLVVLGQSRSLENKTTAASYFSSKATFQSTLSARELETAWRVLQDTSDPVIREELLHALRRSTENPRAIQLLIRLATDSASAGLREAATRNLSSSNPQSLSTLAEILRRETAVGPRIAAVQRLTDSLVDGDHTATPILLQTLTSDSDPHVRISAVECLARVLPNLLATTAAEDRTHLRPLLEALRQAAEGDADEEVRRRALEALETTRDSDR